MTDTDLSRHRRGSCCPDEDRAGCPWPDYCIECGQDWPCETVSHAAAGGRRVILLQDVADGHVVRSSGIGTRLYDHYRAGYADGIGRRLSGRCAELEAAGWIELVDEPKPAYFTAGMRAPQTWRLTAAGRDVLAGASS